MNICVVIFDKVSKIWYLKLNIFTEQPWTDEENEAIDNFIKVHGNPVGGVKGDYIKKMQDAYELLKTRDVKVIRTHFNNRGLVLKAN